MSKGFLEVGQGRAGREQERETECSGSWAYLVEGHGDDAVLVRGG